MDDFLKRRAEAFIAAAERVDLAAYVRYATDTKRRMRDAFLQGVMRGLGLLIGFSVLGALLMLPLSRLAERNLPVIGDFIAEIVELVRMRMQ